MSIKKLVAAVLMAVVAVLGAGATARAADPAAVNQAAQQLQGGWTVTAAVEDGETTTADVLAERSLGAVFTGQKFKFVKGGQVKAEFDYRLDPATKAIDLVNDEKSFTGIYHLDGDTLTLCLNPKARPAKFEAPAGSKNTLLTLKRVPPAPKAETPAKTETPWDFSPMAEYFKPVSGAVSADRRTVTWVIEVQKDLSFNNNSLTGTIFQPTFIDADGKAVYGDTSIKMTGFTGRKGEHVTVTFALPSPEEMERMKTVKVDYRSQVYLPKR